MDTWAIKPHYKGRTFKDRKLTFEFPITNCIIEMDFKISNSVTPVFSWSTKNNTIEKISATEVIMKSRILDVPVNTYLSDLKMTFENGNVETQFLITLQILKPTTE